MVSRDGRKQETMQCLLVIIMYISSDGERSTIMTIKRNP